MPECHRCEVAIEIANGVYRGTPFKETPCARCKLSTEPKHNGRSHVSRDSSGAVEAEESMQVDATMNGDGRPPDERLEQFADFLRQLIRLPPIARDILVFRLAYPDRPLREIAVQHHITVQAAHSRLKRTLAQWPELQAVVRMRTYKGGF